MGAAGQRKRAHHRDELSRGDVLLNPGPWPGATEGAGGTPGRTPARHGRHSLERLAGRAILPALPTKPLPAGSGTGSRGRGERSEGGRGRRRERSVATQERSFATGGGSVPTQRRAQRPGRAPGMASIAGRRPTKPPGGGKGGESNLSGWVGHGPCPALAAASFAAARAGQGP